MPVVLIEKESPQISVVTLNRPERRNALTLELLTELCTAIKVASEQSGATRSNLAWSRRGVLHRSGFEGCRGFDEGACDGGNGGEHFGCYQ